MLLAFAILPRTGFLPPSFGQLVTMPASQCSATFSYALFMNGSLACAARCLASSAFRRQSTLSDDMLALLSRVGFFRVLRPRAPRAALAYAFFIRLVLRRSRTRRHAFWYPPPILESYRRTCRRWAHTYRKRRAQAQESTTQQDGSWRRTTAK
jgi:hypothetical protein